MAQSQLFRAMTPAKRKKNDDSTSRSGAKKRNKRNRRKPRASRSDSRSNS
jgi:hypothetical protein